MANFKGFKQVLAADYAALSADEKKGYMWFVRESVESEEGVIYFGSRLYGNCSTNIDSSDYYTKSEVDTALNGKADVAVVSTITDLIEEIMELIGITMPEDKLALVLSDAFEGANTVVAALELLANKLSEHEAAADVKFAEVEGKIGSLVVTTEVRDEVTYVQLKSGEDVISEFDANQFIVDGMLAEARLEGNTLVLVFNTESGMEDINVDLSSMIKSYVFNESQFVVNGENVSLNEDYIKGLISAAQSGLTIVEGEGVKVTYSTDEQGSAVVTVAAKVDNDMEGNFLAVGENGLYVVFMIDGNDVE